MEIAITILSILHVFVALLLVLIVLWQRPRQEGLGASFGGGMTEQMFGAQTTNVLQKGTVWLAVIFFANTMVIATLMANHTKSRGNSTLLGEPAAATAPAAPVAKPAPSTQIPAAIAPEKPAAPVVEPPPTPEPPAPEPTAPGTDKPAAPAVETPPAPAAPPAPETSKPAP